MSLFPEEKISQNYVQEEWKVVSGFLRYECSSLGRFRRKVTGAIIKGTMAHNGYQHIGLVKEGIQVWKLAHRLIAETWLERPSEKHCDVNHRNKVRNDNRVCNLEWMTRSQNAIHAKQS